MEELLEKIIKKRDLTQNEITILMEAGYKAFSREDLLKEGKRLRKFELYSPAPLTRTIKKLLDKGLLLESDDAKHKKVYSLKVGEKVGEIRYGEYSSVIKEIARSRAVTLNSIRVAAFLLYNKNALCSARYIARGLEMDSEYLVNTVLPRMRVLNLLDKEELTMKNIMHMEKEDIEIVENNNQRSLIGFKLNTQWSADNDESWL